MTKVPRIIGISWWWMALVWLISFATFYSMWFGIGALLCLNVWFWVQLGWLKWAYSRSEAIYWYAVAEIFLVLWIVFKFGFALPGWVAVLLSAMWFGVRLTALFLFREDMQYLFSEVDPVGLRLDPLWTMVLGAVYFQYHLHRIYRMQRLGSVGSWRVTSAGRL